MFENGTTKHKRKFTNIHDPLLEERERKNTYPETNQQTKSLLTHSLSKRMYSDGSLWGRGSEESGCGVPPSLPPLLSPLPTSPSSSCMATPFWIPGKLAAWRSEPPGTRPGVMSRLSAPQPAAATMFLCFSLLSSFFISPSFLSYSIFSLLALLLVILNIYIFSIFSHSFHSLRSLPLIFFFCFSRFSIIFILLSLLSLLATLFLSSLSLSNDLFSRLLFLIVLSQGHLKRYFR